MWIHLFTVFLENISFYILTLPYSISNYTKLLYILLMGHIIDDKKIQACFTE